MSSDIVKGMADEYTRALWVEGNLPGDAMRAALLWLADNVSKEMGVAYLNESNRTGLIRNGIAAAIRAAAGGGE